MYMCHIRTFVRCTRLSPKRNITTAYVLQQNNNIVRVLHVFGSNIFEWQRSLSACDYPIIMIACLLHIVTQVCIFCLFQEVMIPGRQ